MQFHRTRDLALLLLLAIASAAPGGEGPPQAPLGMRPKNSVWCGPYDYGTATAQDPQYGNAKLWPMLRGKESFAAVAWPKARTLTWAKPGVGGDQNGPLDPRDPKNWIDSTTGQPATALFDENTDVHLPAADKPYMIDVCTAIHGRKPWGGTPVPARNVTIGRNADWLLPNIKIMGNLWVQNGGKIGGVVGQFAGDKPVFVRNDNVCQHPNDTGTDKTFLCQYLNVNKSARDILVEMIGQWHTGDEFQVNAGTLVITPDSVVEMGREAYPYIQKQGVIAIMDNAYLAKWIIDWHACDLEVHGGSLQAGLPDRPISRPAYFRFGYKNFTNAKYTASMGMEDGKEEKLPARQQVREIGVVLHAGSSLRSYTTDPAKAKLMISALPKELDITFLRPRRGGPIWKAVESGDGWTKEQIAMMDWLDALPYGNDLAIAKDVVVDGVEFDGLRAGGLMLEDKAMAGWKNVTWGKANQGPPEKLITDLPPGLKGGRGY